MVGDLIHNARTSHSLFLTTISASQRASDRLIGHLLNPLHEARKFFELSPLVYHVLLHAARCLFDLRFSKSRVRRRRKAPNLRASNGCSPSLDLVFRLVGPTGARRLNSPDRTGRDELPFKPHECGQLIVDEPSMGIWRYASQYRGEELEPNPQPRFQYVVGC